jgi:hypothetical protein
LHDLSEVLVTIVSCCGRQAEVVAHRLRRNRLVVAGVMMIAAGYLGDIGVATMPMWSVGTLAWVYLISLLWECIPQAALAEEHRAISWLRGFVTIGWVIYPIGYLVRALSGVPEADGITQLVYHVADREHEWVLKQRQGRPGG